MVLAISGRSIGIMSAKYEYDINDCYLIYKICDNFDEGQLLELAFIGFILVSLWTSLWNG